MNATRLRATPLSQDLQPSRPVLSGHARAEGGLLGLLWSLLPSRAESKAMRSEPLLQSERGEENGGERREPYLFGQRRVSPGTAD